MLLALPAVGCGGEDTGVTGASFGSGSSTGQPIPIGTDGSSSGAGSISASGDSTGDETTTGESTTTAADETGPGDETGSSTGSDTTGPVECEPGGDQPDINYLDEDGDGIDGVACAAVFVSAIAGSDLNGGLGQNDAVQSISRGIEIAATFEPPRMVLVSRGNYSETVNLESGVSIYGGYDPLTWERDIEANRTSVVGDENRTVIAQNLEAAVTMQGFTVEGASYQFDSQSSYAIWVRDTPDGLLTIDSCEVRAGDAGAGDAGEPGTAGDTGGNGAPGSGASGGAGGASTCGANGGIGGSAFDCGSNPGGDGLNGGDGTAVGVGGAPGQNQCGGCSDEGGNASGGGNGGVGADGDGGQSPDSGIGGFDGSGLWMPAVGTPATRGLHGGGGGGGGAGGTDDDGFFCGSDVDLGGGGGGAGAGGCGGEAGGAGMPGGGSFGIVVYASSISITNCDIFMGSGGSGGDGGTGGNGGGHGSFAGGSSGEEEGGSGASGGLGGDGGAGGGGAGGCGGPSVGIATVSGTVINTSNVSFDGGASGEIGIGGSGGVHPGSTQEAPAGEDGCVGLLDDIHDYDA